jgi:hypothetical protein
LNPGRRGGKPASNRLSYGAAFLEVKFIEFWRFVETLFDGTKVL